MASSSDQQHQQEHHHHHHCHHHDEQHSLCHLCSPSLIFHNDNTSSSVAGSKRSLEGDMEAEPKKRKGDKKLEGMQVIDTTTMFSVLSCLHRLLPTTPPRFSMDLKARQELYVRMLDVPEEKRVGEPNEGVDRQGHIKDELVDYVVKDLFGAVTPHDTVILTSYADKTLETDDGIEKTINLIVNKLIETNRARDDVRFIVWSINLGNIHWVADVKRRTVQMWDPMRGAQVDVANKIASFMPKWVADDDDRAFKIIGRPTNLPHQTDFRSCGVFIILYLVLFLIIRPMKEEEGEEPKEEEEEDEEVVVVERPKAGGVSESKESGGGQWCMFRNDPASIFTYRLLLLLWNVSRQPVYEQEATIMDLITRPHYYPQVALPLPKMPSVTDSILQVKAALGGLLQDGWEDKQPFVSTAFKIMNKSIETLSSQPVLFVCGTSLATQDMITTLTQSYNEKERHGLREVVMAVPIDARAIDKQTSPTGKAASTPKGKGSGRGKGKGPKSPPTPTSDEGGGIKRSQWLVCRLKVPSPDLKLTFHGAPELLQHYDEVVSSLKTFAQQQLGYDGTKDPIIECIPVKGLQSVQHSAMVVVMQTLCIYNQLVHQLKKPEDDSGQGSKGEEVQVFKVPETFDMGGDRPMVYKHGILQWMLQAVDYGCPALE